ncbi:MAG: HAMP domain-containing histidine kinase [Lachnospiraceae bacterium]|nr:HAMP domain-containing histidine kinase [Lachnospiraceae bacterium]
MKPQYSEHVRRIADEYSEYYFSSYVDLGDIQRQLELIDRLIDARIWLVNSKAAVLADTRSKALLNVSDQADMLFASSFTNGVEMTGVFAEPMMCFCEPVIYDYAVKGYVCIFVPQSKVDRDAVLYMDVINMGLLIIAGVLFIAFVGIYFLAVYPTRKIRNAAIEYAKGNYDYPMNVKSHDEIRSLADSISYMVGEVKNVDDYQKKFIANISHDFRSPLTSIKGYAEAMKDGTIPYELQGKYLDIILFEADRLTKLTSNLLDLNRMDNKGLMLDITSFDINKVIRNVAAAFEGICRSRKIVIELEFAAMETFVDADMSRIQQVLYNLTDNAIKFSNSDSRIEIETEEKGNKVLIRVRDHGIGIPKDSVKRIWERFYKADSSRGKDKKGTGLGLSIVKEVISAHDENISVISTEGVGTEFTFSLTLSET